MFSTPMAQSQFSFELFSTCKFHSNYVSISLVALKSWLSLSSVEKITLFQTEIDSCNEILNKFNDDKLRCVTINSSTLGPTAEVQELFQLASEYLSTPYVGYLNCDIAVFSDFDEAIKSVYLDTKWMKVVTGRRRDVPLDSNALKVIYENITLLQDIALQYGQPHGYFGKDYFIFPRNLLFSSFPRFLIGRPKWDDWFLTSMLLHDPDVLSVYRLDDAIQVLHLQVGIEPSHARTGAHWNEELFSQLWKCQPIADIRNSYAIVKKANCSENGAFLMQKNKPIDGLSLFLARKGHCNTTIRLYENLSFGAEFSMSARHIFNSCTDCIHVVHTLTACLYCQRYLVHCICMHNKETPKLQMFHSKPLVINERAQQLEWLRRRIVIISEAIENGYQIEYKISGRMPRIQYLRSSDESRNVDFSRRFPRVLCGTYKYPPQREGFISLKPSEEARKLIRTLKRCMQIMLNSHWEEGIDSARLDELVWVSDFEHCVKNFLYK
eukprot:jgi/Galph1/325/GphlegSOOS_G5106.1